MKAILRALLFFAACLAALPSSAKPFEGKVVMEMHSGKHNSTMTYFVRNNAVRLETQDEKGRNSFASIILPEEKKLILLMDEQRSYMVHPFDMDKAVATAQETLNAPAPQKTGRSEKICGYSCDEYTTTHGSDTTAIWVAEGFGYFPLSGGGRGNKSQMWETLAREKGWFVLRSVVLDKKGTEKMRMEAKSVEIIKVDDSKFRPPAGYTEMQMPAIPGLGGLMGH